jgi:hypothetical protein
MSKPTLIADPDAVTAEWLTEVLRHSGAIDSSSAVASFDAKDIGTGQVGANVRFTLAYEGAPGPASIVCKFASRDAQSAATGIQTLTYETEVAFYRDLADTVEISRPHCHFVDIVHGTAEVVLVMEDLAPAEQGDQIAGCSVADAELAIDEVAKLHGPRWGDESLKALGWIDRSGTQGGMAAMYTFFWDQFIDRYRSTLDAVTIEHGERLKTSVDAARTHQPSALTPIHYDYRLDNMLFGGADRPLIVVDWQTVQLGSGPYDVAYFLGNAFDAPVRRECEDALVRRYHSTLVDRYGVGGFSFEECWDEYRRAAHASMVMAIFSSILVGRTDRGDAMFMAMANRSAQMAEDLDTFGLLGS